MFYLDDRRKHYGIIPALFVSYTHEGLMPTRHDIITKHPKGGGTKRVRMINRKRGLGTKVPGNLDSTNSLITKPEGRWNSRRTKVCKHERQKSSIRWANSRRLLWATSISARTALQVVPLVRVVFASAMRMPYSAATQRSISALHNVESSRSFF